MGELHLCWMGNIEQLKQFVSDNIELNGVWISPGGDKKKYSDGDTSISWRKGNKVLRIEGKEKNQINAKLCSIICNSGISREEVSAANNLSSASNCTTSELSVEMEGVKLDITIAEKDICNNKLTIENVEARLNKLTEDFAWMLSNRLLINDSKTEFIIIGSKQQMSKININEITVGESTMEVVQSLGMWFDSHMSMDIHIGKVCSKAFRSLYNIRQIRKILSEDTRKILVHAFVTLHLDYCNSLFYGLPQSQYDRLQSCGLSNPQIRSYYSRFDWPSLASCTVSGDFQDSVAGVQGSSC